MISFQLSYDSLSCCCISTEAILLCINDDGSQSAVKTKITQTKREKFKRTPATVSAVIGMDICTLFLCATRLYVYTRDPQLILSPAVIKVTKNRNKNETT